MKRIYSHPDETIIHLVKNELANRGIEAVIRGEHAAAIVGGGAGIDAWNELWVMDEARLHEALSVIERVIEKSPVQDGAPWTCPRCDEVVEASFDVCWNCGAEGPAEGS